MKNSIHIVYCIFSFQLSGFSQQASFALAVNSIQTHSLSAGGSNNIFTLEKGGCATFRVQGIDVSVLIRVHDPNGNILREYSQWAYDGPLPMNVHADVAGNYSVEVLPLEGDTTGGYWIQLLSLNNASTCSAAAEKQKQDDPQIISWIQKNAIPVSTVEPGNSFSDLMPLKKVLSNAQVIGLGETTHGTSEFFRFKHRMLQFLN